MSEDIPTLTVIVVASVAVIITALLYEGSCPAAFGTPEALGYGCSVASPSSAQVNVIPAVAIIIASPVLKLCVPIVSTIIPVAGTYVAPVGVYCAALSTLSAMYALISF